MVTLKQTLRRTREWSIDRMETLVPIGDKHALYKEFEEEAKTNKRGVWRGEFERPEQWRRKNK